jgi:hypothetical protein
MGKSPLPPSVSNESLTFFNTFSWFLDALSSVEFLKGEATLL